MKIKNTHEHFEEYYLTIKDNISTNILSEEYYYKIKDELQEIVYVMYYKQISKVDAVITLEASLRNLKHLILCEVFLFLTYLFDIVF